MQTKKYHFVCKCLGLADKSIVFSLNKFEAAKIYAQNNGLTCYPYEIKVKKINSNKKYDNIIVSVPPNCSVKEHFWISPYKILRGLKENPGVFGHSSGVVVKQICSHCGIYKTTNNCRNNGVRITYNKADSYSREYILSN